MSIEIAVTVNVECAHRSATGNLHGHSYIVEVWSRAGEDLVLYEQAVKAISAVVDHTLMEESIGAPSMEHLAGWFLLQVTSTGRQVTRVIVRRPTLGYVVEARP